MIHDHRFTDGSKCVGELREYQPSKVLVLQVGTGKIIEKASYGMGPVVEFYRCQSCRLTGILAGLTEPGPPTKRIWEPFTSRSGILSRGL